MSEWHQNYHDQAEIRDENHAVVVRAASPEDATVILRLHQSMSGLLTACKNAVFAVETTDPIDKGWVMPMKDAIAKAKKVHP